VPDAMRWSIEGGASRRNRHRLPFGVGTCIAGCRSFLHRPPSLRRLNVPERCGAEHSPVAPRAPVKKEDTKYSNGVLELKLPKKAQSSAKRLPID
jgi:hypothetical protein